jgi:hypothetical protein
MNTEDGNSNAFPVFVSTILINVSMYLIGAKVVGQLAAESIDDSLFLFGIGIIIFQILLLFKLDAMGANSVQIAVGAFANGVSAWMSMSFALVATTYLSQTSEVAILLPVSVLVLDFAMVLLFTEAR